MEPYNALFLPFKTLCVQMNKIYKVLDLSLMFDMWDTIKICVSVEWNENVFSLSILTCTLWCLFNGSFSLLWKLSHIFFSVFFSFLLHLHIFLHTFPLHIIYLLILSLCFRTFTSQRLLLITPYNSPLFLFLFDIFPIRFKPWIYQYTI